MKVQTPYSKLSFIKASCYEI